jgi:CO dehydrogenase/acetyl-CoA synthase gamma subunit (corrinoid Fe-S protein)
MHKLVATYKIKLNKVKDIINRFDIDYIAEKMTLIENSKKFQSGKVLNISGLLISALESNYQHQTALVAVKQNESVPIKTEKGRLCREDQKASRAFQSFRR